MIFSAATKNLTFKRWDEVKDEKFKYYESSLNYPIFRKSNEKPIYRRELPKKGRLGQFADLRGRLKKNRR